MELELHPSGVHCVGFDHQIIITESIESNCLLKTNSTNNLINLFTSKIIIDRLAKALTADDAGHS